jgi:hypothetical protein
MDDVDRLMEACKKWACAYSLKSNHKEALQSIALNCEGSCSGDLAEAILEYWGIEVEEGDGP